jgi:hypothetical protein
MKKNYTIIYFSWIFLTAFFIPHRSSSYALLSHEAVIDECWDKSIKPLLKQKYPGSTEEQLKKAHAFVYGGAIVPDIGYYPFGSLLFTHLVHYVRTGEFINNLIDEAHNLNEYAFAIGLLCHYNADNFGHPLGTNIAVPILFPKKQKQYGDTVTYEQSPVAHTRVEFGFDVLQTASGNYKEKEYHDFIGFQISDSVLDRALIKTYGIKLKEIFRSFPAAISTFRFTVRNLFPELTKDAWKVRKSIITKLNPMAEKGTYHYKADKKAYKKEFGNIQLKSTVLSLIIGVLPKWGPLAGLKFKEPTEKTERIFRNSFDSIMIHYNHSIKKLSDANPPLANLNYDTGRKSKAGEYELADASEFTLLKKLAHKKFQDVNSETQKSLIDFFKTPGASNAYSKRKWKKINLILGKINTAA